MNIRINKSNGFWSEDIDVDITPNELRELSYNENTKQFSPFIQEFVFRLLLLIKKHE